MKVFLFSDPHFRHANLITKYRGYSNVEEHDEMIIRNWNSTVNSKDKVFLLGDLSIEKDVSDLIIRLNGNITIVGGNHDLPKHLINYSKLPNVNGIAGIIKYKGFWLTHGPLHSSELRGKRNIHGHTHKGIMKRFGFPDKRYVNICAERIDFKPIEFNKIKEL